MHLKGEKYRERQKYHSELQMAVWKDWMSSLTPEQKVMHREAAKLDKDWQAATTLEESRRIRAAHHAIIDKLQEELI